MNAQNISVKLHILLLDFLLLLLLCIKTRLRVKELAHGAGLMVFELESTWSVIQNLVLGLLGNYNAFLGSQIILKGCTLL